MSKSTARRNGRRATYGSGEADRCLLWLDDIDGTDVPDVGPEAVALGALRRTLTAHGMRVPNGFVTGARASAALLAAPVGPFSTMEPRSNGSAPRGGTAPPSRVDDLASMLERILTPDGRADRLDVTDACDMVRRLCLAMPVPENVTVELEQAHRVLRSVYDAGICVAVRASVLTANGERSDAPLRVVVLGADGAGALVDAWRESVACALSEPAVIEQLRNGVDVSEIGVPVVVTEMVSARFATTGLASTHDLETGNPAFVTIAVTGGSTGALSDGDGGSERLLLWKEALRDGRCAVVRRGEAGLGRMDFLETGDTSPHGGAAARPADAPRLTQAEVHDLARMALAAEEALGGPLTVEWARVGSSSAFHVMRAWRDATPSRRPGTDARRVRERSVRSGRPSGGARAALHVEVEDPDRALAEAMLQTDGAGPVGLDRLVESHVGIHPLALAHFEALSELADNGSLHPVLEPFQDLISAAGRPRVSDLIERVRARARPTESAQESMLLVEALRSAVGRICAAYHPRPVVVRLSALDSIGYRRLLGGDLFESEEENPMIAWRGTARLVDRRYRPAFELECSALRAVREDLGLDNLHLLAPFCRTPEEGGALARLLAEHGLGTADGVPLHLRIDVPANVILADDFIREMRPSGAWIAVDELVHTIYALSREDLAGYADSIGVCAHAVRTMIGQAVERFRLRGLPIGAGGCGREALGFVLERGVDAISVAADAVPEARMALAAAVAADRTRSKGR